MTQYKDITDDTYCMTLADTFWRAFFFVCSIVIFYVIPCIILIIIYAVISKNLMKPAPGLAQTTSATLRYRKQVILMLGTVVISFFILLLPFRILTILIILLPEDLFYQFYFSHQNLYYIILFTSRILVYLNSAINPILYNLMSSKFRNGFYKLFFINNRLFRLFFICHDTVSRKNTLSSSLVTTTTTNLTSSSMMKHQYSISSAHSTKNSMKSNKCHSVKYNTKSVQQRMDSRRSKKANHCSHCDRHIAMNVQDFTAHSDAGDDENEINKLSINSKDMLSGGKLSRHEKILENKYDDYKWGDNVNNVKSCKYREFCCRHQQHSCKSLKNSTKKFEDSLIHERPKKIKFNEFNKFGPVVVIVDRMEQIEIDHSEIAHIKQHSTVHEAQTRKLLDEHIHELVESTDIDVNKNKKTVMRSDRQIRRSSTHDLFSGKRCDQGNSAVISDFSPTHLESLYVGSSKFDSRINLKETLSFPNNKDKTLGVDWKQAFKEPLNPNSCHNHYTNKRSSTIGKYDAVDRKVKELWNKSFEYCRAGECSGIINESSGQFNQSDLCRSCCNTQAYQTFDAFQKQKAKSIDESQKKHTDILKRLKNQPPYSFDWSDYQNYRAQPLDNACSEFGHCGKNNVNPNAQKCSKCSALNKHFSRRKSFDVNFYNSKENLVQKVSSCHSGNLRSSSRRKSCDFGQLTKENYLISQRKLNRNSYETSNLGRRNFELSSSNECMHEKDQCSIFENPMTTSNHRTYRQTQGNTENELGMSHTTQNLPTSNVKPSLKTLQSHHKVKKISENTTKKFDYRVSEKSNKFDFKPIARRSSLSNCFPEISQSSKASSSVKEARKIYHSLSFHMGTMDESHEDIDWPCRVANDDSCAKDTDSYDDSCAKDTDTMVSRNKDLKSNDEDRKQGRKFALKKRKSLNF